jgi:SNF2 family DNA or RNA helicase
MNLKPYLEWMNEEAPPAIWSRGIALARTAKAEVTVEKDGVSAEIKLKLQTAERLLAYQVTLWPNDEDSYCNCENKNQPCAHVIAAAQIYDQGRASLPETGDDAKTVKYFWEFDKKPTPWKLSLLRTLGGKPLNTSLISLVGGIESGRIAQPMPVTTSIDLKIDDLLNRSRDIGARLDWANLLKLVKELPAIPLNGSATLLVPQLSCSAAKLIIKVSDEIQFKKIIPEFTKLAEGMAMSDNSIFLQPEGADSPTPQNVRTADLENFLLETLPKLHDQFEVQIEGELPKIEEVPPTLVLKLDRLGDATSDRLVVTPILQYILANGNAVRVLEGKLILDLPVKSIPRRDRAAETALIQKLRRELNLTLNQPASFAGNDALSFTQKLSHTSFSVKDSGKHNGQSTGSEAVLESYQNDQTYRPEIELQDGKLKLFFLNRKGSRVEVSEQQLQKLSDHPGHPVMDSLKEYGRISEDFWNEFGAEIMRLSALKELKGVDQAVARALTQEIKGITLAEEIFPLTDLDSTLLEKLRPYQKQGAAWIISRIQQGLSGALLADEMGLGKTVQTIAALQTPALVVVPTSLISNWVSEIKRFRPSLSVNIYHGGNRAWKSDADVCLTTYGVIRQEVVQFQERAMQKPFAMTVMDEAHVLRNQETLSAQAIRAIPSRFKLALSGTPIQNHLRDLYSLFSIIQSDLFPNSDEFFETVEQPRLFQAKTSPLILRRLKENVLTELPAKTQMFHAVELIEEEQREYNLRLGSARKEIQERVVAAGASPVTLFEVLLRARQVCDHRALFIEEHANATSSKLDALKELLKELTENGHSVLVYSQWTKFLDLIEISFDQDQELKKIQTERLDGSTSNRSKVIERFQGSENPTIFLLSLHAGGVGLNLTKADHVIFCEPWWNPFVELQAEDRVHRMGQDKPVFIHRLIVQGSIEEGMLRLQEKKRDLQAALSMEDIKNLVRAD